MINVPYTGPQDLSQTIPLFPVGGALLLPRGQLPLNVFEPRYMTMIDESLSSHRLIGMIQPEGEDESALYKVGCVGRITEFHETGDGRYLCGKRGLNQAVPSSKGGLYLVFRRF